MIQRTFDHFARAIIVNTLPSQVVDLAIHGVRGLKMRFVRIAETVRAVGKMCVRVWKGH